MEERKVKAPGKLNRRPNIPIRLKPPRKRKTRREPLAMVNSSRSARTTPMRVMGVTNHPLGQGIRLRGNEIVQTLTASATTTGTVVVRIPINPSVIGASRLKSLCSNFDRFWFHSIGFSLHTAQSTSATGSVIGYFDPNANDDINAESQSVRLTTASNHVGAREFNYWQPKMNWNTAYKTQISGGLLVNQLLYVNTNDEEPVLVMQGTFNLLVGAPLSATALGLLWCHYDVSVLFPQDGPQSVPSFGSYFKISGSGTQTQNFPFGSGVVTGAGPPLLKTFVNATYTNISLSSSGTYHLFFHWADSNNSTGSTWVITAVNSVDSVSTYTLSAGVGAIGATSVTAKTMFAGYALVIEGVPSNSGNYFSVSIAGTVPAVTCSVYCFFVQAGFTSRRRGMDKYVNDIIDRRIRERMDLFEIKENKNDDDVPSIFSNFHFLEVSEEKKDKI